jgi:hypothetical protein
VAWGELFRAGKELRVDLVNKRGLLAYGLPD